MRGDDTIPSDGLADYAPIEDQTFTNTPINNIASDVNYAGASTFSSGEGGNNIATQVDQMAFGALSNTSPDTGADARMTAAVDRVAMGTFGTAIPAASSMPATAEGYGADQLGDENMPDMQRGPRMPPSSHNYGSNPDLSDQYFTDVAPVTAPRIYDEIELRGRNFNDTPNDVAFGKTAGQDFDNDGVPSSMDINIAASGEPHLNIADYPEFKSDRSTADLGQMLNNPAEFREYAAESDQLFASSHAELGSRNYNPYDTPVDDQYPSPEIYTKQDLDDDYIKNDTINDIIFGDTFGQDRDNDGVPYALESGNDLMDQRYSDLFSDRGTNMDDSNDLYPTMDQMDDNYENVFGEKRPISNTEISKNIRQNLRKRFSDNDVLTSEVARGRLSHKVQSSDAAEEAMKRAQLMAEMGSGRLRRMSAARSSRVGDGYIMPTSGYGDTMSYANESDLLNNGVAAQAMRQARNM